MVDLEPTKQRLIKQLLRWLILGIPLLLYRFLRWGGILGLVGIGLFAVAIWLAFDRADPATGELTGAESGTVFGLMLLGIALYVVGVRRRKRARARLAPPPLAP